MPSILPMAGGQLRLGVRVPQSIEVLDAAYRAVGYNPNLHPMRFRFWMNPIPQLKSRPFPPMLADGYGFGFSRSYNGAEMNNSLYAIRLLIPHWAVVAVFNAASWGAWRRHRRQPANTPGFDIKGPSEIGRGQIASGRMDSRT